MFTRAVRKIVAYAGILVVPSLVLADQALIRSLSGSAELNSTDQKTWHAAKPGEKIAGGQTLRTRPRSRARLEMADGSRVEVYPNSQINMDNLKATSPSLSVTIGKLKAWVTKNMTRRSFQVHTPVAVCSVRGTEFTVSVGENGKSDIEVTEGLVGVRREDGSGEEVPVGAGERLNIIDDRPLSPDMKSEAFRDRNTIRRELGLEMSKESVQAAAASEMKLAEYQEGKTMIDVNGQRVRLEEYIMRPAPDTFKLVVLNERNDRLDYFYYRGKFNTTLPEDLGTALRQMNGTLGAAAPDYYLTEYEKGYSNTRDYVKDNATGGHLVRITYNANGTFTLTDANDPANTRVVNAADAVNGAYDPLSDTFDAARTTPLDLAVYNSVTGAWQDFTAGQTFWKPRYNSYEHVIDGVRKQWYIPSNASANILTADLEGHWIYPGLDGAGNTIYGEWGTASSEASYPDPNLLHQRINFTYRDNTFERYDTCIIDDEGKIARRAEFGALLTGSGYKDALLKWNYEQVITATEFGGRKIDLVVEPKILIKSGVIQ